MRFTLIIFTFALITSCVPNQGSKSFNNSQEADETPSTRSIGKWERKSINTSDKNIDPVTKSIAETTAFISHSNGTGTGIYIGQIGEFHLLLTSAHVIMNQKKFLCKDTLSITINSKRAICNRVITYQKNNDLVILEISFLDPPGPNTSLLRFKTSFSKEELLINVGYATENSALTGLTSNSDEYCRVFSNQIKQLSVKKNSVWSMAIGCDSSPGNSGSAIVNRDSGEILGIIWGVGQSKERELKNKFFIDHLNISTDDSIWKFLTYATPSLKIQQQLIKDIEDNNFSDEDLILAEELLELFI